MRLYERYFADIDALNDDKIVELRDYHEETKSLIKHYYMDIPLDICMTLKEFDAKCSERLLGTDWHEALLDIYKDFKKGIAGRNKSEACLKAEFSKQALEVFYDAMDYIFRDGFNTNSQTAQDALSGLTGLLFGTE